MKTDDFIISTFCQSEHQIYKELNLKKLPELRKRGRELKLKNFSWVTKKELCIMIVKYISLDELYSLKCNNW